MRRLCGLRGDRVGAERGAVDLLVERGQFPEIERIVNAVDLGQQIQERMIGDFLDPVGLGDVLLQMQGNRITPSLN